VNWPIWERDADWPVRLLWPVVPGGFARRWIPWADWGGTAVLLAGLLGCILLRRHCQACAVASLAALALDVGIRGPCCAPVRECGEIMDQGDGFPILLLVNALRKWAIVGGGEGFFPKSMVANGPGKRSFFPLPRHLGMSLDSL
jgi:hypothetical protein